MQVNDDAIGLRSEACNTLNPIVPFYPEEKISG